MKNTNTMKIAANAMIAISNGDEYHYGWYTFSENDQGVLTVFDRYQGVIWELPCGPLARKQRLVEWIEDYME